MRVVLRAENTYKKRHNKYAESLGGFGGDGISHKRMARSTDRGDYTASFHPKHEGPDHDGFVLTMTPKQLDNEHRSFYAEEDGRFTPTSRRPRIWIRRSEVSRRRRRSYLKLLNILDPSRRLCRSTALVLGRPSYEWGISSFNK